MTAPSQGSRSWPKRAAQVVWWKGLWPPSLRREIPHCRQIFGAAEQIFPQSQQQKPNVKVIWSINFSLILDWRFQGFTWLPAMAVRPNLLQSSSSCCSMVMSGTRIIVMEPVSYMNSMGFKISLPGGKRWPSKSIGSDLPKPVGKAQRMWLGSFWSRALSSMSN